MKVNNLYCRDKKKAVTPDSVRRISNNQENNIRQKGLYALFFFYHRTVEWFEAILGPSLNILC